MPSIRIFTATLILATVSAAIHAAELVNADFEGTEAIQIGDVTRNPITVDPMGTWILGGNDNSDNWSVLNIGGTNGNVASNNTGSEAQGLLQWVQDDKSMTGTDTLQFDFNKQVGTGGDYDLHLYVFGWNAGDNVPGVDYENGTAETGDSFIPDDSVNLITDVTGTEGRLVLSDNGADSFAGVVDGAGFQPISVNLDFGSGFDFIGVLFYGENGASDGILQLDNIQFGSNLAVIPEPTSIAIWSLLGVGIVGFGVHRLRRRRK